MNDPNGFSVYKGEYHLFFQYHPFSKAWMNKKKVTFNDIAKYTNFSKTTISRYFNNPDSLTVENQEIISQALTDLGYQKNKLARVLYSFGPPIAGMTAAFFYYL